MARSRNIVEYIFVGHSVKPNNPKPEFLYQIATLKKESTNYSLIKPPVNTIF